MPRQPNSPAEPPPAASRAAGPSEVAPEDATPEAASGVPTLRDRLSKVIALAHLKLALRATIAGIVTYLLAEQFALPNGYWAVLTAVLVVQATLGASLSVAIDRALGTLAGGVVGVAGAMLAGKSPLETLLVLSVALFIAAALAARSTSFKLAPVTVVIVMLAHPGDVAPWLSGLTRVAEIALGGVVGLLCAILILPERALGKMFPYCAKALRLTAQLLDLGRGGLLGQGIDPSVIDRLNGGARLALRAADLRLVEVRAEQAGRLTTQTDPAPVVRGARRLWHSAIILLRNADRPLDEPVAGLVSATLTAATAALSAQMSAIADRLDGQPVADLATRADAASAAVAALEARVEELNTQGAFGAVGAETLTALFSAVSACVHMRENLEELAARLAEVQGEAP
ncbi:FUSC family protein [Xanthobacter autotrophicus]|uniref:FUSC family protein n=1 Tax=Xanthobacter autotrophicus TaxID=280 RepID=UPI001E5D988D|nr:FUSC family protein [Xanthobacter autotrophicus]UDQ89711.1 FUSC family protein [Xanthobacter autotrophicus]